MPIIRVKPDVVCVVYDAESDTRVPLRGGMEFDSDDPIVAQFPDMFAVDADEKRAPRKRATAVEVASAEPGTKRNR
jgi:hypothetical protein